MTYYEKILKLDDKQAICDLLVPALKKTRACYDLCGLEYDDEEELVYAYFPGGKVTINVSMDSGIEMIRDILKNIED